MARWALIDPSDEQVRRETGVEPDTKCIRCHKTAKQKTMEAPTDTGIDHYAYQYTHSFYGNKMCASCHKEHGLERLFAVMDAKGL